MHFRSKFTNINQVHVGKCNIYMDTFKLFFIWRPHYQRRNKWYHLDSYFWYTIHCEGCVMVWQHHYQRKNIWISYWQQNDIQWYFFKHLYLMISCQCHQNESSVNKVFCKIYKHKQGQLVIIAFECHWRLCIRFVLMLMLLQSVGY